MDTRMTMHVAVSSGSKGGLWGDDNPADCNVPDFWGILLSAWMSAVI